MAHAWGIGGQGAGRGPLGAALRYAAVAPIVAASTAVAEVFYRVTGSDRLSSIFLAGVLLAAFLLGSGPAYLAAALAFGVYMFLVDPRYQFTFGSADDFNALMVFLAVAGLTGLLTGRVRDEAARAKARQRVNGALLDATRAFSATSDELLIRRALASHLSRAARAPAAVADGEVVLCDPPQDGGPELAAALAGAAPTTRADGREVLTHGAWHTHALFDGEDLLGIAAWRSPAGERLSEEELTALALLADAGAAAIARARLASGKAEAETRARTEDLRNALLSSISHDLRTPLASILASASSLRAYGDDFDASTRADLAATIQEEAERLDTFVANLLSMTRLEAGALSILATPFSVHEVVQRTLERRRLAARVAVDAAARELPMALGDAMLFEQALGNVVENAIRYGAAEGTVSISSTATDGRIVISVLDEGPGVSPEDVERIFEKFYRGRQAPRASGAGLGLSIVRGLMRAMGGEARAANRDHGGPGLVVTLTLATA